MSGDGATQFLGFILRWVVVLFSLTGNESLKNILVAIKLSRVASIKFIFQFLRFLVLILQDYHLFLFDIIFGLIGIDTIILSINGHLLVILVIQRIFALLLIVLVNWISVRITILLDQFQLNCLRAGLGPRVRYVVLCLVGRKAHLYLILLICCFDCLWP